MTRIFQIIEQMLLEKQNIFKILSAPSFWQKEKDVVANIATVQSN